MRQPALFVLLFMIFASNANAYFFNGAELKELVSSNGNVARGYIMGVSDVLENITVCKPKNYSVTAGQLESIVVQFLKKRSDMHGHSAAEVTATALAEAFPCKEK